MATVAEIFDEEISHVGLVIDDENVEWSGSRLWHGDCSTPRSR
jgi:hypothetical protein